MARITHRIDKDTNKTSKFIDGVKAEHTEKPKSNITEKLIFKAKKNLAKNKNHRTKITLKEKAKALLPILSSMLSGTEVSQERISKRLEVCSNCELLILINDKPACGVCGCRLGTPNREIVNLVSLEETDKYGCKHPNGSRWKANNV